MQSNKPLFYNSKKSRCNDCTGEKFPCTACSKALDSSPQDQDSLSNQPISLNSQQFREPSFHKKAASVIPERVKPTHDMLNNNKCSSCDENDATRLCLVCNKICCNGCALDYHEGHKIMKISEVSETLQSKTIQLDQNIADIENLITGKEGVSKELKDKEDKAMEEVDSFFQSCYEILQNKRQAIKKEIQKKLADIAAEHSEKALRDAYNSNKVSEALDWIQYAKNIFRDIENNKIADKNSLLCSLYKQEEEYKKIDVSKLKNINDDVVPDGRNFCQIQLKCNNQILEVLKKENILEIKIHQFVKKNEISQNSNRRIQDSSPIQIPLNSNNATASDWEQKDFPKPAPVKTDLSKDLKKAFENKLEIQVRTNTDSDYILLESISKHNSNNPNVNNGLKNDAHVELFNEILSTKALKESCQRVSHLILDFFNLTEEGIFSLYEAISHLPSLQTIQFSFYMYKSFYLSTKIKRTLGLYPINLKPLFEILTKLKFLKDLSLKFPTWTHLKGTAFLPLLSSISNISTLQSLSLDLSRCSKLDLQGISEALKYLLRHKNLEKLQISFKGCLNIGDDDNALENLYQNCLNSKFRGIKLDFTECPKLSDESIEVINDLNQRKLY